VEYRSFGKSGKKVSRLGYGGATAGLKNYLVFYDPAKTEDRDQVVEAVYTAYERGINYFDTAPSYGNGESERIFGEALASVNSNTIVLATKVTLRDIKKGGIRRSLEQSLKNLRRDRIDILQFHGSSYSVELADRILEKGGFLEEMEQCKCEGLISMCGFTTEDNNDAVYRFIYSGRFDMYQACYNVVMQHPYDPVRQVGSMLEAEAQGMGIVVMRSTTSAWFQKFIKAANPANAFDYTPALIQYVLSNKHVDVALVGMRSRIRVESNVAIAEDLDGRFNLEEMLKYYVG
jgi:aryl-alcohol dehydrogenase-like predicted oxidoreductase